MAVGPDQMADLDSIETPINERSASSAAGDDLLRPDAPARFATQGDKLNPSSVPAACSVYPPRRANAFRVSAAIACGLSASQLSPFKQEPFRFPSGIPRY